MAEHTGISFFLNAQHMRTDLPAGLRVLDFLRQHLRLTGTKEGCREGDCGACMVLLGEMRGEGPRYRAVPSCLLPIGELSGRHLVTIEGLGNGTAGPVQQTLVDEGAPQCGYCMPGIVISLTSFLLNADRADPRQAIQAVDGNLCRCTGYAAIKRAAFRLTERMTAVLTGSPPSTFARIEALVEEQVLPPYFPEIARRLQVLPTGKAPQASALIVAGGTDLFVQRPEELRKRSLFFVSESHADLTEIGCTDTTCYIGAGATISDVRASLELRRILPRLPEWLELVASTPVRDRATVGGNIVNASPIGDLTILLLALDAKLLIRSADGERAVPLREFFKGYKQVDLVPGELLQRVEFAIPRGRHYVNFEKVSKRRHLDIATVNSAALIELGDDGRVVRCGLSAGGVAPIPLYLQEACRFLVGKEPTADVLKQATETALAEIHPIDDVRGSAAYKRLLLRQLMLAHFLTMGLLRPSEVRGILEEWRRRRTS